MQIVAKITGSQLRPGMMVSRMEETKKPTVKIPALNNVTSHCSKGVHFGNGCYDTIAPWYLWW